MWLLQSSLNLGGEPSNKIDFLIVLIGVILGLSIGKLVTFIGDFLYHRKHGQASLTHGFFLFAVFVYQIYYWWDLWSLKADLADENVNFLIFLVMLLIPLCLFCATALLCPKLNYAEEEVSLKSLFDDHCVPFYFFWVFICAVGVFQGMYIREESLSDPQIFVRISAAGILLTGMIARKSWLNTILAVLMFIVLIGYIALPMFEGKIPFLK